MASENNQVVEAPKEYLPTDVVPVSERNVTFLDAMATWAGASLQPTVWTIGGMFICVGIFSGLLDAFLSSFIPFLFVGLFGVMATYIGMTTAGMAHFTLGARGTKIMSVLSIINSCGWSVVSNYMAAITYSYIFNIYFGTPAYGTPGCELPMVIGCLLNGILSYIAVGVGGTKLMVLFQKIMMACLLVLSVVLYVILLRNLSWADFQNFVVPDEYKTPFFYAFDMMFATVLAFCVIGGDFGRNIKKKSSAMWGSVIGGTVALVAFIFMGMLGVLHEYKNTGVIDQNAANPSALAMSLGLGIVALIVVLFATVTTNMMDVFTMTNNYCNLLPKLGYKKCAVLGGVTPMLFCWLPIVISSFFDVFYTFADILGAVFPPLFVMMLMDFFVIRKKNYDTDQVKTVGGKYWYSNGINIYAFVYWVIGTIVFILLHVVLGITFFSNVIISMVIQAVLYYIIANLAIKKGYYK